MRNVEIPVLLRLYDQEFKLYNLQPVHLELPNQQDMVMKILHQPNIAINQDAGTYVILQENWKKAMECKGKYKVYCDSIITEHYIMNAKNCELSIVSNKTSEIKENCKFAILKKASIEPRIHRIKNNKVLIENPQGVNIYKKCMDSSRKEYITNNMLVEIEIPCFCSLLSDTFTTTLITSDVCVTTPQVDLYDPMKTILFIEMLLNITTFGNITMDMIPRLEMPHLISDF